MSDTEALQAIIDGLATSIRLLTRVAEQLANPPTYPLQPMVPLSHCPGCRCEELDSAESSLRDRLNLGERISLGGELPPHTQYEILMKEIRAGNFNTIGRRQAKECVHGVEWVSMSYQHWIANHNKGDHP